MLHLSKFLKPIILTAGVALLPFVGGCTPVDADPAAPDAPVIAEVLVTPDSVAGIVGTSLRFSAAVRNNRGQAMNGEPVEWTSSDPTIASVSSVGDVTLLSAGTAEISATSKGKSGRGKVTVRPVTLQSFVLAPPSVSLNAGATQQFSVSGTWSDGSTTAPAAVYSATGGSINAAGLFTAGNTAGGFRVIASHSGGTLADTSTVTVVVTPPPPPVLQALVLSPSSVSLNAGATQQFSVSGTWSDGSTTAPAATYSATGGTISAAGLYTAGANAGLFRLIAVQSGGTRADTSNITVVVPTPPPPAGLVNECSTPGAGWIWCDDFDTNRLTSYFEVATAGGNFARVSGVGNENSYGMRARWTAGATDAGALHLAFGRTPQAAFRPADAGTANHREIYFRVYLRNQAGWVGGGGDKLMRAMIFASPTSWAQAMIAHVWAGDNDTQYENILMLDPARGTDAAGNLLTTRYNDFANLTWLGISRGTAPLFSAASVGQWHCVEAHVRLNDAGLSNGMNELWINGNLEASRTGINWVGSYNAYGINAVFLENWWNQGSPVAQERYLDNFVVSTQRIGC